MKIEKTKIINKEIIEFSNKILKDNNYLNFNNKLKILKEKNVECLLIKINDVICSCCFMLPTVINGQKVYWLFNLFSSKNKGMGLILIKHIMNNYENVCCVGVTPEAEILYDKIGWKKINNYKRYIKVINLKLFFDRYNNRINIYKKIAVSIHYYMCLILNFPLKKNINKPSYDYVIANKIIRVLDNYEKINFSYGKYISVNMKKDNLAIEFLSNYKQNLLSSLMNGFIKIDSPIFYFSKDTKINNTIIMNNIFSFKNTDKIF